jgi:hypothetical protein
MEIGRCERCGRPTYGSGNLCSLCSTGSSANVKTLDAPAALATSQGAVKPSPTAASREAKSTARKPRSRTGGKWNRRRLSYVVLSVVVLIAVVISLVQRGSPSAANSAPPTSLQGRVQTAVAKIKHDSVSWTIPRPTVQIVGTAATISYVTTSFWNENDLVLNVAIADPQIMVAAFSAAPQLQTVSIDWQTDFLDQYGKSSRESAIFARWTRATVEKIDLSGFTNLVTGDPTRFYELCAHYQINLALWRKATKYNQKLSAMGP